MDFGTTVIVALIILGASLLIGILMSEIAIAEKQNKLEIKKAELKKNADIKRAEADAA